MVSVDAGEVTRRNIGICAGLGQNIPDNQAKVRLDLKQIKVKLSEPNQ